MKKQTEWSFWSATKESKKGTKYNRMITDVDELRDIVKEADEKGHNRVSWNMFGERESKAGNLGRTVSASTWKAVEKAEVGE